MPLNASEKTLIAQSFLKCFGEDAQTCGRALKFLSVYTAGNVNLLATLQAAALVWQPFVASGLSIDWWNGEVVRIYNLTDTT